MGALNHLCTPARHPTVLKALNLPPSLPRASPPQHLLDGQGRWGVMDCQRWDTFLDWLAHNGLLTAHTQPQRGQVRGARRMAAAQRQGLVLAATKATLCGGDCRPWPLGACVCWASVPRCQVCCTNQQGSGCTPAGDPALRAVLRPTLAGPLLPTLLALQSGPYNWQAGDADDSCDGDPGGNVLREDVRASALFTNAFLPQQ